MESWFNLIARLKSTAIVTKKTNHFTFMLSKTLTPSMLDKISWSPIFKVKIQEVQNAGILNKTKKLLQVQMRS